MRHSHHHHHHYHGHHGGRPVPMGSMGWYVQLGFLGVFAIFIGAMFLGIYTIDPASCLLTGGLLSLTIGIVIIVVIIVMYSKMGIVTPPQPQMGPIYIQPGQPYQMPQQPGYYQPPPPYYTPPQQPYYPPPQAPPYQPPPPPPNQPKY